MKSKILQSDEQDTFILVFEKGDEIVSVLRTFAEDRGLRACHFTGIGALSEVTLGFFDRELKTYRRIPIKEQAEILSLTGNVAMGPKGIEVHAHIVVGNADGTTRGGHLLEGRVWPTLEVVMEETPAGLRRAIDPETGLALIDVSFNPPADVVRRFSDDAKR